MGLDRDTLLALSTVIWATGEVAPSSAAAMVEAARVCGLHGDDLLAIERATREPVDTVSLAPLELDGSQRMFAYGLATWLARANDVLVPSEKSVLAALGDRLSLSHEQRVRAAAAAHAIRHASDPVRDHDIAALARELARQEA